MSGMTRDGRVCLGMAGDDQGKLGMTSDYW